MAGKVLLIEDEQGLRTTLRDRLSTEGYDVETAGDGEQGYAMAMADGFDVIILDIMLPGKSGFDVCRDLRRKGIRSGILMLTARGEVGDRVHGLKIGADDYLTKPFETLELLARMEALVRRANAASALHGETVQLGEVRVNLKRREVERGDQTIPLSAKESLLLRFFLEHRGEVLARERLFREVWGHGASTSSRTLDVHVAWLRQKIEQDSHQPRWILTVHGLGYRFAE